MEEGRRRVEGEWGKRKRKVVKDEIRKKWRSRKWWRWKRDYGGVRDKNEEEGLEEGRVDTEEKKMEEEEEGMKVEEGKKKG